MNGIPPIKKYLAECIGTLMLVVFGCGTAVAVGCDGTATFGSSCVCDLERWSATCDVR